MLPYSPSLHAAIGHGSDALGIPRGRAQRDDDRAHLYAGWHGLLGPRDYITPEGPQRTDNHEECFGGGNIFADYERARGWWVQRLRDHLHRGLCFGEGPDPGMYVKRYCGAWAAVVRASMEQGDNELCSLVTTAWSSLVALELLCEAPDGHAYMACVRGNGNAGTVLGQSDQRDACRRLVRGGAPDARARRLVEENPVKPAPPTGSSEHGAWMQRQLNAAPWMEFGLVLDVARAGFRVRAGVGLPRSLPGTYRVTRGDGGHRSEWIGTVDVPWGGALIDGVDVIHDPVRVVSRSWTDRGMDYRQARTMHGPHDPLPLPGSRSGTVHEISPTSRAPELLTLTAPPWRGGEPNGDDPGIVVDRTGGGGREGLWEGLVGEIESFRDSRRVKRALGIVERLRRGER